MTTQLSATEQQESAEPAVQKGPTSSGPQGAPLRVLVVDDQDMQRLIVRRALEKLGHEVIEADSGITALEQININNCDMIISDWLMDQMDGLALCQAVRARNDLPYIYFMLMSSRDSRDDLLAGLNAGADDYLPKPLDMDELAVRIRIGQRLITLQASLNERNRQLDQALSQINADIESAGEFQRGLLPQDRLQSSRSRFDWIFLPSARVSGDALNYFRLDEHHIGFYNVDVAGHGLASGMVGMLMAQSLDPRSSGCVLRTVQRDGSVTVTPPAAAIDALNTQMTSFDLGMNYLTCVYGALDERTGQVQLVRAGHTWPIVIDSNGNARVIDEDGDMPVGMFDSAEFHEITVQLQPGDRLILYSDGVTEAETPSGEALETERFCRLLGDALNDSPATALSTVATALKNWCALPKLQFGDDVSILVIEYAGVNANVPPDLPRH